MRVLTLALIAVLSVVVGCADASSQAIACPDDSGCPDGLVCAFGQCLDPADQRLSVVDVEIDPANAGLPVQSSFGVDLRVSPRVDVALAPGVLVTGDVRRSDTGALIDALVVARPERFIPGRVLAPATQSTEAAGFSFLAVDDGRYALTVVPGDASIPPAYLFEPVGFRADADLDGAQSLEPLLLPAADADVIALSGRVRAGEGAAAQGVPDLEVRLVDATGRRWSTSSRTGQDGSFVLRLPTDAGGLAGLVLEVLPTGDNDAYPALRVENVDTTASIDLGIINLGAISAPVPLRARVLDAAGVPVPGAVARFTGAIGAGTFARTAEVGAEGVLDVNLPPGVYQAVIVGPPEQPAAGIFVVESLTVPATGELVLSLSQRATWFGAVRDVEGVALAGAQLEVVRVGDVDGEPEPALADILVAFLAETGETGEFTVPLDPGRYRVSTRPAPGSNAPAFSELVTIPAEGLVRDVELPARAVVAGTVVFDGTPVGGAYVRVFSSLVDERGAAILLGEGAAGPDGAFEIAVPDLVGEPPAPEDP